MSVEIPFVTMKWRPDNVVEEHKMFTSKHVNAMLAMLQKTQSRSFRLICVTDDAAGLDPSIKHVPLPQGGQEMINQYGGCWVQLYLFSLEFRERLGARFIYSDLDVAILGDMGALYNQAKNLTIMEGRLAPLFTAVEDITGIPAPRDFRWNVFMKLLQGGQIAKATHYSKVARQRWCRYNGSYMIIDKEQPDDMWSGLNPGEAKKATIAAHLLGSNQAWLQLRKQGEIKSVGKNEGFWFKRDVEDYYALHRRLPADLRMIIFAGEKSKPWSSLMQEQAWVRDVYPSL